MAKAYSCLPSEIVGVDPGPKAFYFNRAVFRFCGKVEADMDAAECAAKTDTQKRSARIVAFNRHMNPDDIHKGAYRDPAAKKSTSPRIKGWGPKG
jgi:hypothetical protein